MFLTRYVPSCHMHINGTDSVRQEAYSQNTFNFCKMLHQCMQDHPLLQKYHTSSIPRARLISSLVCFLSSIAQSRKSDLASLLACHTRIYTVLVRNCLFCNRCHILARITTIAFY
jgi:hypothetical protein